MDLFFDRTSCHAELRNALFPALLGGLGNDSAFGGASGSRRWWDMGMMGLLWVYYGFTMIHYGLLWFNDV